MEILRKLAQLAGTDRTAIVYGDGTLSYRTLDHWSDAFASRRGAAMCRSM